MTAGEILRIMKELPDLKLDIIKLAEESVREDGRIDYELMTRDETRFNTARIQAREHTYSVRETADRILKRLR